jgi:hypothetical protein
VANIAAIAIIASSNIPLVQVDSFCMTSFIAMHLYPTDSKKRAGHGSGAKSNRDNEGPDERLLQLL